MVGSNRWIIGGGAQDNEACVRAMSQGNAIITLQCSRSLFYLILIIT